MSAKTIATMKIEKSIKNNSNKDNNRNNNIKDRNCNSKLTSITLNILRILYDFSQNPTYDRKSCCIVSQWTNSTMV